MVVISRKACYKTVSHDGEAMLTEKKSKFIASVRPADTEEKALAFLAEVRGKYPDATHNVYAYVIDENNIFRYSDDGEPGGTAGMPVLDTIRKEGIVDAAVVVTRYFGGTLLGTGGLVHAYGAAARQGLLAAGVVTRTLCNVVCVHVDYALSGKIQYMVANSGYILEDSIYGSDVAFYVCCKIEDADRFIAEAVDVTNGRAVCTVMEQKYIDL